LNCQESSSVPEAVLKEINTAIESTTLQNIYYGSLSALNLNSKNSHAFELKKAMPELVSKIVGLFEGGNGMAKGGTLEEVSTSKTSLLNTAIALSCLSNFATSVQLEQEEKNQIESIIDQFNDIFLLADEGEEEEEDVKTGDSLEIGSFSRLKPSWFSFKKEPSLRITSLILESVSQLYTIFKLKPISLTEVQAAKLAEFLVRSKNNVGVEECYSIITGLKALTNPSSRLPSPLIISALKESLLASLKGAEGQVRLRVTDLLDKDVPSVVFLLKASPTSEPSTVILSNQEVAGENGAYSLNFLGAKPEPGFYQLQFSVRPSAEKTKYVGIESYVQIKILTTVSVSNFELQLFESSLLKRKETINFGEKLESSLNIESASQIQFSLKLKNQVHGKVIKAQQVFLKFTHTQTNEEIIIVLLPDQTSYKIKLGTKEFSLFSENGNYQIELIVGDPFIQNMISWNFVNVRMNAASGIKRNQAWEEKPLPEIHHVFRTPEKRPPQFVSFAFTLAVCVPLLILLIGIFLVGGNLKNFPGGLSFFWAVGFQLSLLSVLVLFSFYWLQLNMITTLKYLGVLSIPCLIFGQKTLYSRAVKRLSPN
jgi:oligosaccharyltransferase complex subunit delta (ribophorin II)